jgi:hypothetical protein
MHFQTPLVESGCFRRNWHMPSHGTISPLRHVTLTIASALPLSEAEQGTVAHPDRCALTAATTPPQMQWPPVPLIDHQATLTAANWPLFPVNSLVTHSRCRRLIPEQHRRIDLTHRRPTLPQDPSVVETPTFSLILVDLVHFNAFTPHPQMIRCDCEFTINWYIGLNSFPNGYGRPGQTSTVEQIAIYPLFVTVVFSFHSSSTNGYRKKIWMPKNYCICSHTDRLVTTLSTVIW